MADRLINRGSYIELQRDDNAAIWAQVLNGISGQISSIISGIADKRERDRKEQEARFSLQTEIAKLDPSIQTDLYRSSPELRRFLIDPKQLALDPEQKKALDTGMITPLMPKVRGRTPLEVAKLTEAQESARKEANLADKAGSEASLQRDVTGQRQALMKSDNPYEQILGLTGEVMTSDKLEALMTGLNAPEVALTNYLAKTPGTMAFKEQSRQKVEAELISKVNPQTPEDMQGVRDVANYVAGLGPQPRKMPKTLERLKTDIDAWQTRISEQNMQISDTRLRMETNAKIMALGETLSQRLRGTGREGEAFSLAEAAIRKGAVPTNLPPDLQGKVADELKQVELITNKVKYEQLLQQSPKLQMLLDLASKSSAAGDKKGAEQYIKMAEQERKRIFGEDKAAATEEKKKFWDTVLSMSGGFAAGMNVPGAMYFAQAPLETKIEMMRWAGTTAGEIKEVLGQVPGAVMRTAEKGMVTSPGQRQLSPSTGDEEVEFRAWYKAHAKKLGLSADPDDPAHKYDYRAAYRAGAKPDKDGHWPSQFKAADHPNRYVNGVDTITGQPVRLPTAPPPSSGGPTAKLPPEQIQGLENMLRDIEKLSHMALTPEKRAQLLTEIQMIEDVRAGRRPFSDILAADR